MADDQCPTCGCPTKCDEAAYGRLYDALLDLLDTVERGDEYRLRERMVVAGVELKLERYLQLIDGTPRATDGIDK